MHLCWAATCGFSYSEFVWSPDGLLCIFGLHSILQQWDLIIRVLKRKLHQNFLLFVFKLLGGILIGKKGKASLRWNRAWDLFFTFLGHLWCDWAVTTLCCLLSKFHIVLILTWLIFSLMGAFLYLGTFYKPFFSCSVCLSDMGWKLYFRRIYRKVKLCFLLCLYLFPLFPILLSAVLPTMEPWPQVSTLALRLFS